MDIKTLTPALLVLFASIVGQIVTIYVARTSFKRELKARFCDQLNRELFDLCGDFIVNFSIDEINNIQAIAIRDEESYNIKSKDSFTVLYLFLERHKDIYKLSYKEQILILQETYVEMNITSILPSEHFASLQKASKSIELIKHNILKKLK